MKPGSAVRGQGSGAAAGSFGRCRPQAGDRMRSRRASSVACGPFRWKQSTGPRRRRTRNHRRPMGLQTSGLRARTASSLRQCSLWPSPHGRDRSGMRGEQLRRVCPAPHVKSHNSGRRRGRLPEEIPRCGWWHRESNKVDDPQKAYQIEKDLLRLTSSRVKDRPHGCNRHGSGYQDASLLGSLWSHQFSLLLRCGLQIA
jgi:hypothetical protein